MRIRQRRRQALCGGSRAIARSDRQQESAELARIRKKLNPSQKEAAAIAGDGGNAFSRYEHGKSKQVAAVVNLFRILDKYPELVKEIR